MCHYVADCVTVVTLTATRTESGVVMRVHISVSVTQAGYGRVGSGDSPLGSRVGVRGQRGSLGLLHRAQFLAPPFPDPATPGRVMPTPWKAYTQMTFHTQIPRFLRQDT